MTNIAFVSAARRTADSSSRRQTSFGQRVVLAVAVPTLLLGSMDLAAAQIYYAPRHVYARDYMAQVGPAGGGGVVGAWRYGLAAHRPMDRAYPMTEWSGPATATGGPSGGIN